MSSTITSPFICVETETQQFRAQWLAPRTHIVQHNGCKFSLPSGIDYDDWLQQLSKLFRSIESDHEDEPVHSMDIVTPEVGAIWPTETPLGTIAIHFGNGHWVSIEAASPNVLVRPVLGGIGPNKVVLMIPVDLTLSEWLHEIAETMTETVDFGVRANDAPFTLITRFHPSNMVEDLMLLPILKGMHYVVEDAGEDYDDEEEEEEVEEGEEEEEDEEEPLQSGEQQRSSFFLFTRGGEGNEVASSIRYVVNILATKRAIINVGGLYVGLTVPVECQDLNAYLQQLVSSIDDNQTLYLDMSDVEWKVRACGQ